MLNKTLCESNRTLWIFGDSFSTPYDNKTLGEWGMEYANWKGYIPKTFGDIIGEELAIEVKHCGIGGVDNDTIFEEIIKQAPNIRSGDMVIIGWSSIGRFRLRDRENHWRTFIPNFIDLSLKMFDMISKRTIEEVIVNRDMEGYKDELYTKIEFLNWLFKDMKLIHWTPFTYNGIRIFGFRSVNTILMETNGVLRDGHFSESGHTQLASKFIEMFNNDKLRIEANTLYKKLI